MAESILKNKAFKASVSLGLISATGAIAYYFFNDHDSNDNTVYSDAKLIEATKLINRNYFPIYLRISKQGR